VAVVLSHRLRSSKLDYLELAAASGSFCKELSERHNVEIATKHSGGRYFEVSLKRGRVGTHDNVVVPRVSGSSRLGGRGEGDGGFGGEVEEGEGFLQV
jgi:hypothetical protein